jgi:hypothetical protein
VTSLRAMPLPWDFRQKKPRRWWLPCERQSLLWTRPLLRRPRTLLPLNPLLQRQLTTPAEPDVPAASQDSADNVAAPESASAPPTDSDTQAVAEETALADQTPNAETPAPSTPSRAAPQKSSVSTLFFVFLVAVVLLFWLVSQEDDEAALAPAPALVTESERSEKPESAQRPAADSDLAPPVPVPARLPRLRRAPTLG